MIQLLIGITVLSIPIIGFVIYLRTLNNKAKRVTENFRNSHSAELVDVNVLIKNFDIWNKTKKFDLDAHGTTYDFNYCDLIISHNSILVTGKIKLLGTTKLFNPTIFSRTGEESQFYEITNRVVEIIRIRANNSNLELDFIDPNYTNEMTLVIKNLSNEAIEQIRRATTNAKNP